MNPVVDPKGSRKIYEKINSDQKEYCLLSFNRHVLVDGEEAHRVHRKIAAFIENDMTKKTSRKES